MNRKITNLVLEGGGVLGIAYLGMLDYMNTYHMIKPIKRVAGTSAGAITACVVSFNVSFEEMKQISYSLDYSKVPDRENEIDGVKRLLTKYGWYSSNYIYMWMQGVIAKQFDENQKAPPYTFRDFKEVKYHKDERAFKDLSVIGTSISENKAQVFSYEMTPDMEVAQAVRISMSVPLFFEAVFLDEEILADGGVMWNYPIQIFDSITPPFKTLGARFNGQTKPKPVRNLMDYMIQVFSSATKVQKYLYGVSPIDQKRSININTGEVQALDFNIQVGDSTYDYLYKQGYEAARNYFKRG